VAHIVGVGVSIFKTVFLAGAPLILEEEMLGVVNVGLVLAGLIGVFGGGGVKVAFQRGYIMELVSLDRWIWRER